MSLEREPVRASVDRGVDINPPLRWNRIDTSGLLPQLGEGLGVGRQIEQIRFGIKQERDNEEKESGEEQIPQKTNGFEPFKFDEPQAGDLFVTQYRGNFFHQMQLNRRGVERVLEIAHLDGKIFLSSLSPSRSRSEAQGDELAARRFVPFDNKRQKVEEDPLSRVISVPEGWGIEVNDAKITEELTERKLDDKELQTAFVGRFNGLVKEGLFECVRREKLSNVKDKDSIKNLITNFVYVPILSSVHTVVLTELASYAYHFDNNRLYIAIFDVGFIFLMFTGVNLMDELARREDKREHRRFRKNIDHKWEYFMPSVEVDKVIRTFAYLSGKGRELVREV